MYGDQVMHIVHDHIRDCLWKSGDVPGGLELNLECHGYDRLPWFTNFRSPSNYAPEGMIPVSIASRPCFSIKAGCYRNPLDG